MKPKLRMSLQSGYLLLFLILGIATFWRFYQLDYRSLGFDEVEVINAAQAESLLDVILGARAHMSAPPVDYLLRHFWQQVGGVEDRWVRAYSAIWGLAGVFFTYLLGQKLFETPTGLLAGFLLAISYYHVRYSAEVKFYAPLVVFYLAIHFTWLLAKERGHRKYWIVYGSIALFGVYTHPYTIFAIVFCTMGSFIQWITGLIKKNEGTILSAHLKETLIVSSVIATGYFPWVVWDYIGQAKGWAPPELSITFFESVIFLFAPGMRLGGLSILAGLALAPVLRIRSRQKDELPLWLSLIISPFLVFFLDRWGNYPLMEKQLIFLQPIMLIFSSGGLIYLLNGAFSLLPNPYRFSMNVIPVVAIGVFFLILTYSELANEKNPANWQFHNWRSVVQRIQRDLQPTDKIYWADESSTVINWYLSRLNLQEQSIELFPWWDSRVLNLSDLSTLASNNPGRAWFFGVPTDKLFESIGARDAVVFDKVGGVNIYLIDDLTKWDYRVITQDENLILQPGSNYSSRELFFISSFVYQIEVKASAGGGGSARLDLKSGNADILPNPSAPNVHFLLPPKTDEYKLEFINKSDHETIVIEEAVAFPRRRVGPHIHIQRSDVWEAILTGSSSVDTNDLSETFVWEYVTEDSAIFRFWVSEPGFYTIKVRGSTFGPPKAEGGVSVDGTHVGTVTFDNFWEIQSLDVEFSFPGPHDITLIYLNNLSNEEGDRDLLIDWVELSFQPKSN